MTSISTTAGSSPAAVGKDMHWLRRYARHGRVTLNTSQHEANALKGCFTQAAWRLLCRSGRDSFIPILRNRRLAFESLVHYAQTLVEHGFQVAPSSEFLEYFIQSSYLFFDRMPGVPDSAEKMTLLHLATRNGAVSRAQLRRVHEWVGPGRGSVTRHMSWHAVLRRANDWHQRQQVVVDHAKANHKSIEPQNGWHFACRTLSWRGYEITPLVNSIDLWDEGQAMSSCLYKLRFLCDKAGDPSRFFSIRKEGRRYATLELVRNKPHEYRHVSFQFDDHWRLQDCRLSHNRLPSEALVCTLVDFGRHYDHLSRRHSRRPAETSYSALALTPASTK